MFARRAAATVTIAKIAHGCEMNVRKEGQKTLEESTELGRQIKRSRDSTCLNERENMKSTAMFNKTCNRVHVLETIVETGFEHMVVKCA